MRFHPPLLPHASSISFPPPLYSRLTPPPSGLKLIVAERNLVISTTAVKLGGDWLFISTDHGCDREDIRQR